ncbi:MAG: multiheme c-type cytochrome [Candidatus Eisenbacteria bacterium]
MTHHHLLRPLRMAATFAIALAALGAAPTPVRDPDHLFVLSTTDVKGKTSPCGCHTPKGGLARRAAFADSVRAEHGQVVLVDAGGFYPETESQRETGAFLMESMKRLGTAAANVGDPELRYGYASLVAEAKGAGLPLVSANLWNTRTNRPAFLPWTIVPAGRVKVGVFGLASAQSDLGPAKDSLRVEDPESAAVRAVAELRKKGATVIVLLSQLGKVESEDLVTAVEGIDVVVTGRNVPMIQRGRLIKNTVAVYGGEQGWYVGVSKLALDAGGRMVTGENDMVMLGPEVEGEPGMLGRVKAFEDALNDRLRRLEKERAAAASVGDADADGDMVEHFVGADVCARCHRAEYEQWRTTPHGRAWQTLVDERKDATPECVRCHVVGYGKPGGFQTGADAPRLANVQCENCHGMGTQHEAYAANHAVVPEATCRGCHDGTTSPVFDFAKYRPHILHVPPAVMPELPPNPAKALMRAKGAH